MMTSADSFSPIGHSLHTLSLPSSPPRGFPQTHETSRFFVDVVGARAPFHLALARATDALALTAHFPSQNPGPCTRRVLSLEAKAATDRLVEELAFLHYRQDRFPPRSHASAADDVALLADLGVIVQEMQDRAESLMQQHVHVPGRGLARFRSLTLSIMAANRLSSLV